MNRLLRLLSILAPLLTAACAPTAPPNILLISLDTLRADSLGCYGYERDTTPFLDRLAAEGVRFEHAYANTLATLPSHTSILSGQYQESHGVLWQARPPEEGTVRLPESIPWLPESLAAAGYTTLAVTDGGNFAERHGFDRGFDEFDGRRAKGVVRGIRRLLAMLDRHPAPETDTGRPLFVLFHTYEIHAPYDPPPPFDTAFGGEAESGFVPDSEALRSVIDSAVSELSEADFQHIRRLYDAGIRFTDESLESLFGELEARGFFARDHLVVVTSDHGEEFGERGGVLHRGLLYEELIRIPLILRGARLPAGEVREELVSSVDIAPTILDYAGMPVPEAMQGRSLLEARPDERRYVVAQFRDRRYAVRLGRFKLIDSAAPELYDLSLDPGETTNLAPERPERVEELRRLLDGWRAVQTSHRPESGEVVEPTADEIEELRALGYVD